MNVSPHPADRLIQELIRSRRVASADEVEQILQRIATTPFNPSTVTVDADDRGLTYQGHTLGAREDSLFYHLAKRVVAQQQWTRGTTADRYVQDLRDAVQHPSARLIVYRRGDIDVAGVIAPNAVPMRRRGRRALPWIYVVYSATRGILVTGYQVSSIQAVSVPGEAQWLR